MINTFQVEKTLARWKTRTKQRNRNIDLIKKEKYFDADSPERVNKFFKRRGFTNNDKAKAVSAIKGIPLLVESSKRPGEFLTLERIMGTNDLVGISFLEYGLRISKTVARIWICNSTGTLVGYGTGFMISPNLLLTNHHVLPDALTAKNSYAEFNYQIGLDSGLAPTEKFQLDPGSFYFSDEELDYAMVAVCPENNSKGFVGNYGWNSLSKDEGKTIISQWLNIIQHPNGEPKQVGLRENQLIDVLDNFLHYKTDTAPGSSGSPVFNENWEVVALHHSGVWATDKTGKILSINGGLWSKNMGEDQIKWVANEGVRVSSILSHMERRNFSSKQQELYEQLFLKNNNLIKSTQTMENMNKSNDNSVNVSSDGTVTWTIPLSVSVKLGGLTPNLKSGNNINNNTSSSNKDYGFVDSTNEKDILTEAKSEFMKISGVIGVRLGYVFENGWITKKRAIVVSVKKRLSRKDLEKSNIPTISPSFKGYPVEVTGPTIAQLISETHGKGKLESLMNANALGNEIRYFPPAGEKLKKVTNEQMKVTLHVSPEKGWEQLSDFISKTKKSLSIAMYDFGAKHIRDGLKAVGKKSTFKKMILAIQPGQSVGSGTKENDDTDKEIVDNIKSALKSKFAASWVNKGAVNGWISTSYHIKVAVRDSSAFWLSSGNWQSSNQPDIEKLDNQDQKYLLKNYNREWHAVVEHAGLAKSFEKYIKHDFDNNLENGSPDEAFLMDGLDFFVPNIELESAFEASEKVYESFEPFVKDRKFTVTPLLTPDNFFDEMLKLVKTAQKELLIQNQTFNAPYEGHEKLAELIDTVLEKQKMGVKVYIIFRTIISSNTRENIEALVDRGFDPAFIKVQKNCHTKGVIVDGKQVALGSQNWSNDGVSVNRDASLIFDDEEAAQYFRKIFWHDWKNLAVSNIGRENLSLEIAPKGAKAPAGMELITWKDIKELL